MQQENSQECRLQTTARRSLVVVEQLRQNFVHQCLQASILVKLVERLTLDQVVVGSHICRPNVYIAIRVIVVFERLRK